VTAQPTGAQSLPIVNICTTIRQHSKFLPSFLAQVSALTSAGFRLGTVNIVHDVPAIGPDPRLQSYADSEPRAVLIPEEASDSALTELEQKVLQWARIGNQALESALSRECTHILYVESDLCFPLDTVDQLLGCECDIIAPLVLLGGVFYDSWGFRDLEGRKIYSLEAFPRQGPVELSSVGSCVLFRAEVFRAGIRFRAPYDSGLFVGVCHDARAKGFKVWADPTTSIIHPTSLWKNQTWEVRRLRILRPRAPIPDAALDVTPGAGRIAGFYSHFALEWLTSVWPQIAPHAGADIFGLTVIRNPLTRTLEFELSGHGPAPPGLSGAPIAPDVSHRVA
jgi:hypothetical protein